jgi:hypothetical protein
VRWLPPLGFENRFALAVRAETARRLGVRTVSDLAREAPRLAGAFSSDFLGRADGLPGLSRAYGLRLASVRPLAPAVKYQAIAAGDVDVIDAYSTDGLVARYGLVVLDDDRRFFRPTRPRRSRRARSCATRPVRRSPSPSWPVGSTRRRCGRSTAGRRWTASPPPRWPPARCARSASRTPGASRRSAAPMRGAAAWPHICGRSEARWRGAPAGTSPSPSPRSSPRARWASRSASGSSAARAPPTRWCAARA